MVPPRTSRSRASSARNTAVQNKTGSSSRTSTAKSGRGSARSKPYEAKKGSGKGLYIILGIGAVLLIGALSYNPIRRSIALGELESTPDTDLAAAIAKADAYLALAGDQPNHINSVIRQDSGPVPAQIHMAKQLKLFDALMIVAERPIGTGERQITLTDRIAALKTGAEIYDSEKNDDAILPDDIKKWARGEDGGEQQRELAEATIALLVKTNPKGVLDLFSSIIRDANQDPIIANAAIAGMASLVGPDNVGQLISLLNSPGTDLVLANEQARERISKLANGNQLEQLTNMIESESPAVRALVFAAFGSPLMRVGDSPAEIRQRQVLGERIKPSLSADNPVEVAGALQAVRGLRLNDADDAVLALIPGLAGRQLPEIDADVMADILGRALITTIPAPELPKDGKYTPNDELALGLRKQSDALIGKLTAGLDNAETRTVCAKALGLISDKSFLALRDSLDKLAEHADDPDCLTSLRTLVDRTYGRDDVTKKCGANKDAWVKYLAEDRPNFERIKEIILWMKENGKYQLVSDGKERLGQSKDYIQKAQAELDAWLSDKSFLPPIGLTRGKIDILNQDLKMLGMNVRKAWSGAL